VARILRQEGQALQIHLEHLEITSIKALVHNKLAVAVHNRIQMLHKDKQDLQGEELLRDEELLQGRGRELLRDRGKDVGVVDLLLLRKHHTVSRNQLARVPILHHQEGHQVHILLNLNMANLPHQEHIRLSQRMVLHLNNQLMARNQHMVLHLQPPLLLTKDSCPTSRAKFQEAKVECSLVQQLV